MTTATAATGYPTVGRDGHVELAADHPGIADGHYRVRRDEIAAASSSWRPGAPVPVITYSATEHATWATVRSELGPLWAASAARSFLDSVEALALPGDHAPQLDEVTAALTRAGSTWRYLPVAGLAPLREFYGAFAGRTFWSTQYLRHASSPLYTPEPDICHEVLGHAHHLVDPALDRLYRVVAATTSRLETETALRVLSRVFWRTVEFGAVREGGRVRAWGAGLLSSFGELAALAAATPLPVDLAAMGTLGYDITHYQTEVFVAPSWSWVADELPAWVEAFDDEAAAALVAAAG